jgi:hypothetical protein
MILCFGNNINRFHHKNPTNINHKSSEIEENNLPKFEQTITPEIST